MTKGIKNTIITTLITSLILGIVGLVMHILQTRVDDKLLAKKQQTETVKETEPTDKENQNNESDQGYMFIANINDPDGYTNVRSAPTKQSDVVDKILEGEDFKVLGLLNSWYKVESPTGKIGFVYFNRVKKKD